MGDYEAVLGEVRRSDMMRGIWSSYVSASPYAEGVDFAESRGQNGAGYLSCGAPNGEPRPFTMALECAAAFRSEFARLSM